VRLWARAKQQNLVVTSYIAHKDWTAWLGRRDSNLCILDCNSPKTPSQGVRIRTSASWNRAGCERVFAEKESGAKSNRPALAKMMAQVTHGDVVVGPETCSTRWAPSLRLVWASVR